jgi:hypothetical protein
MKKWLWLCLLIGVGATAWAQTPDPPKTPKPEDYAGSYKMASFFTNLKTQVKDGALYGELDSYGQYLFKALEEADTFQSTSSYGTVFVFRRDPSTKRVVGVTVKLMGQEVTGDKEQ